MAAPQKRWLVSSTLVSKSKARSRTPNIRPRHSGHLDTTNPLNCKCFPSKSSPSSRINSKFGTYFENSAQHNSRCSSTLISRLRQTLRRCWRDHYQRLSQHVIWHSGHSAAGRLGLWFGGLHNDVWRNHYLRVSLYVIWRMPWPKGSDCDRGRLNCRVLFCMRLHLLILMLYYFLNGFSCSFDYPKCCVPTSVWSHKRPKWEVLLWMSTYSAFHKTQDY